MSPETTHAFFVFIGIIAVCIIGACWLSWKATNNQSGNAQPKRRPGRRRAHTSLKETLVSINKRPQRNTEPGHRANSKQLERATL